jgi:tetratricopeptide (TPR) repeat protein
VSSTSSVVESFICNPLQHELVRVLMLVFFGMVAIATTTRAQTSAPSSLETQRALLHYRLGWESVRAEAWADAVKEFQQAIDINRRFKLAYYGLGRAFMGLRQFQEAATAYERCRALYQEQASENFSNTLDADKIRQDDQQQLQIAIQQLARGPQSQTTQNQIQQLRNQQQRIQLKRDATRDVALGSAVPAFVSLALGSAYFRAERLADAEREYKAAVDIDPRAGEAHNNLAVVYMLAGRYDDAEREIKAAEASGFRVSPQFKEDLKKARSKG